MTYKRGCNFHFSCHLFLSITFTFSIIRNFQSYIYIIFPKLLLFEDYWAIDEEQDLITDIKYSDYEENLSSSEKVLLSIWRHQYYDAIPTKEFLLCSINEDVIYKIYKILDKVKFYHMYQMAHL